MYAHPPAGDYATVCRARERERERGRVSEYGRMNRRRVGACSDLYGRLNDVRRVSWPPTPERASERRALHTVAGLAGPGRVDMQMIYWTFFWWRCVLLGRRLNLPARAPRRFALELRRTRHLYSRDTADFRPISYVN